VYQALAEAVLVVLLAVVAAPAVALTPRLLSQPSSLLDRVPFEAVPLSQDPSQYDYHPVYVDDAQNALALDLEHRLE
jgi:hypothetical protein